MKTPCTTIASLAVAAAALALATPAQALFKVVNPDGSITYTDRPPPPTPNARVTPLGRPGSAPAEPDNPMPPELRQTMQRYPVTLYTTSECGPCNTGRQMLLTRGIPFNERRVSTEEDAQALERLFGTRTLPVVTIGPQALRGYSESDWGAYLDAANYPKQSRLPRGWQLPPATAMVERTTVPPGQATVARQPPPGAPAAAAEPAAEESPPPATGVRF
jgi:glutaredoxin